MKNLFIIKSLGERAYLPAPEQGEPDGLWRSQIVLTSCESEEEERDEIVATLWDDNAFLPLQVGDKVIATLQFYLDAESDGSLCQIVYITDIQRITDYKYCEW